MLGIGFNKTRAFNHAYIRGELIHNNETWNLNIMFEEDGNLRCILRYDEIKATGKLHSLAAILVVMHFESCKPIWH